MALFFQGEKPAVLWDAKSNKPEFQFVKRFLETSDKKLAKRLCALGYEQADEETFGGGVETPSGNIKGASTAAAPATPQPSERGAPRIRRTNVPAGK